MNPKILRIVSLLVSLPLIIIGLAHAQLQAATGANDEAVFFPVIVHMSQPPEIELAPYATGFTGLTDMAHVGDGRIFVVEQEGVIRIIDPSGSVLPTPFLDINDLVVQEDWEQGMFGLAFHPSYADNGYFYVTYTSIGAVGVSPYRWNLVRYSVSADPNVADRSSARVILTVPKQRTRHNGGAVNFGPQDGYLYASIGEDFTPENAQVRDILLGKIVRLDVDHGLPYTIPADNPFVGDPTTADEIWALGLRNPWRFRFDALTGDMYIGDVGNAIWEEVDRQPGNSPGGENYGWPCFEGNHIFHDWSCDAGTSYTMPITEYMHESSRCSVVGGYVYRGLETPQWYGSYFFADSCSGELFALTPFDGGEWGRTILGQMPIFVSSIGEDADGELYAMGYLHDTLYRILLP